MHKVPVINIVRTAATATAILNTGHRRYRVALIAGKKSGTKAGKMLPDGNASLGISNLNDYQQVALNRASLHFD
ncbi:TPA: hypothetical protein OTQ91_003888 [Klebsiella quasipneumoniae]|nr:hypothetical protein [Klebsiella quasipneumoniae]